MVEKEYIEAMKALQCSLSGKDIGKITDWELAGDILLKQGMGAVFYESLWRQQFEDVFSKQLNQTLKDVTCYTALISASQRDDIERILVEAEKRNLTIVLFKGAVVADTYPEWKCRYSSDTDFFVYEQEQAMACEMMEALGYTLDEVNTKEKVKVYVNETRGHMVEVHFSLWEDYEGKQVELLDSLNLTQKESLQRYVLGKIAAYTLSPTNHLIFQMFHIIKHFVVKGIGIKQILDIYFFLNKYGKEIEMNAFWRAMDLLGYSEFCNSYFYIAIDYLGMDDGIVSFRNASCDTSKRDLLLAELFAYGTQHDSSYDIISIMSPYLEGRNGNTQSNGFSRKMALLFPAPDALQDDFAYAKRHHILLPIAWVHKWCRFLLNRLTRKSVSATQKIQQADKRIQLMQELDLMRK